MRKIAWHQRRRASSEIKGQKESIDIGLKKLMSNPRPYPLSLLEISNECKCNWKSIRNIELRALRKCYYQLDEYMKI